MRVSHRIRHFLRLALWMSAPLLLLAGPAALSARPALAAVGEDEDEDDERPRLGREYEDQAGGFAIQPPAGWGRDWSGESGEARFLGPRIENLRATLTVAHKPLEEDAEPFAGWVEKFVGAERERLQNFHLERRTQRELSGHAVVEFLITYELPVRPRGAADGGEPGADERASVMGMIKSVLLAESPHFRYQVVCTTAAHHFNQGRTSKSIRDSLHSFRIFAPRMRRGSATREFIFDSPACSLRAPQDWHLRRADEQSSGLALYAGPVSRLQPMVAIVVNRIPDRNSIEAYTEVIRRRLLAGRSPIAGSVKSGKISGLPAREFAWEQRGDSESLWRFCAIVGAPQAKYVIRANVRLTDAQLAEVPIRKLVASFRVLKPARPTASPPPSPTETPAAGATEVSPSPE